MVESSDGGKSVLAVTSNFTLNASFGGTRNTRRWIFMSVVSTYILVDRPVNDIAFTIGTCQRIEKFGGGHGHDE